jgi:hypothetical protein
MVVSQAAGNHIGFKDIFWSQSTGKRQLTGGC